MDWKRERDGLAVVGGVVLVIGLLVAGASVVQFASTLLAAFLGGLLALRVGAPTDVKDDGPTPAATSDADQSEDLDDDGPDEGPPSNAVGRDPKDGEAPVDRVNGEESADGSRTESADEARTESADGSRTESADEARTESADGSRTESADEPAGDPSDRT